MSVNPSSSLPAAAPMTSSLIRLASAAASLVVAALLSAAALLSVSCSRPADIPFTVADHYFFRNDATIPADPLIADRATFDSLFGAAAVMGRNGMPTPIDFDTQFVIAVVRPITDIVTELVPVSLVFDSAPGTTPSSGTDPDSGLGSSSGTLTLTYHESLGERTSYSMRPLLLIIVNRSDLPSDLPSVRLSVQ
jgi:hypothetical protein